MMIPLPLLIGFLILSMVGFIAILVMSGPSKGKKRARMRDVVLNRNSAAVQAANGEAAKGKAGGSNKRDIAKKLKAAEGREEAQKNIKSLTSLIGQAGFEFSLVAFWIYSAIFGAITSFLIWEYSGLNMIVRLLLVFTCFFGIPRFFLKWRATKRQRAFLQDFANALEDMIRLLKAGMPITEAISMVAREYTGPVGEEMQKVYEQQRLGTPLPEAVQKMTLRLPLPEVQMFATTIAIQVQTGSSLSEVLGNLANVIRQRYSLKRKIVALSSEAKISAMIIGSIPFILTGILYLVNRDYIMLLFEHPTGQMLTGIALGMMGVGVLVMRQMINFKV